MHRQPPRLIYRLTYTRIARCMAMVYTLRHRPCQCTITTIIDVQ